MAESTRSRLAFERYWRLGERRSLQRLHEALQREGRAPTLRTLEEWSRRCHWIDRIADLEREARRTDDEARLSALREMAERHAREGLLLQQKGTEWLTTLDGPSVTADAAIRAIAEGIRLERLALGHVTDRTETLTADPRLERLTDDELDRLLRLAESPLGGGVTPPPGESPSLGDGAPPDRGPSV